MSLGIHAREQIEGFDPRSLPGLEFWVDSEQPNGLGTAPPVDLQGVVPWKDLSGKGLDAAGYSGAYYRKANWNRCSIGLVNPSGLTKVSGYGTSSLGFVFPNTPYCGLNAYEWVAAQAVSGIYTSEMVPVTAGETITVMASVRGVAGRHFYVGVYSYDASGTGTYLGRCSDTAMNDASATSTGYWTSAAFVATAPVGSVSMNIQVYTTDAVVGETYQAIGIGLGSGSVGANYFLPPGNGSGVQFNGLSTILYTDPLYKGNCDVSMYTMFEFYGCRDGNTDCIPLICYDGNNFMFFQLFNIGIGFVYVNTFASTNTGIRTGAAAAGKPNLFGASGAAAGPARFYADGVWNGYELAQGTGLSSNICVGGYFGQQGMIIMKGALVYSKKHDAATQRRVSNWLAAKYKATLTRP